jgi:pantoate--beta-alanine ligase
MPILKPPQVISSPTEMRRIVDARRREGARIGVVPTMGALHEGHLSLVRKSRQSYDCTVATIFVNQAQFGPNEDFARYPRTLDQDLALLATEGTDYVFCPTTETMYPPGFSTYVEPPAVSRRLEGEIRPGHFRGVCTVVLKLLEAIPADIAFFGQKDFQQALVIQHMARDLNLLTAIEVCPIVRDADGLALSSRNRYLSAGEREKALGLSQALARASAATSAGEKKAESLRQQMRETLLHFGVDSIDYVSIANVDTLEELEEIGGHAVALIAARVGATRLIDNALLGDDVSISMPPFKVKD